MSDSAEDTAVYVLPHSKKTGSQKPYLDRSVDIKKKVLKDNNVSLIRRHLPLYTWALRRLLPKQSPLFQGQNKTQLQPRRSRILSVQSCLPNLCFMVRI